MTTIIFDHLNYTTLKYIGDEVMLFREFIEGGDSLEIMAKQAYDIIFDDQKWYFGEINRFNPILRNDKIIGENKKHIISVKICLSVVENVSKISDAKKFAEEISVNKVNDAKKNEAEEIYDIFGTEVDMSARIKEFSNENMVTANEKFTEFLKKNGGEYSRAFTEYRWKKKLQGSKEEEIKYFGKEIWGL
jgi:hypothetical protein